MEISTLKEKLIQKINTADENALLMVEQVLDALEKGQTDYFDTLPLEIQEILKESIKQIDTGETYTHEQVKEMTNEKYGLK